MKKQSLLTFGEEDSDRNESDIVRLEEGLSKYCFETGCADTR